jgi:hypothetical protein
VSHKQELTERERVKCAYLHLVCGVEQQHLCIAFETNIGRVSEAITAIELAISDPKEMRHRMEMREILKAVVA